MQLCKLVCHYISLNAVTKVFMQVHEIECSPIRNVGKLVALKNFKAILNTSLDLGAPYKVWIHDPDFYVKSINPSSTPRIDITLNLTGRYFTLEIKYEALHIYVYCECYTKVTSTNTSDDHFRLWIKFQIHHLDQGSCILI